MMKSLNNFVSNLATPQKAYITHRFSEDGSSPKTCFFFENDFTSMTAAFQHFAWVPGDALLAERSLEVLASLCEHLTRRAEEGQAE